MSNWEIRNVHIERAKAVPHCSDVVVMSLADLPDEERKRYEVMGFTIKPVIRRVIKPQPPKVKRRPAPESLWHG